MLSKLTPGTIVTSVVGAGAETITLPAPAKRKGVNFSLSFNAPEASSSKT